MRQGLRRGTSKAIMALMGAGALLAGCSGPSEEAGYDSVEYAEAEAAAESADMETDASADAMEAAADTAAREGSGGVGALPDIPASMPKIAYVYEYGFELPGAEIAALQKKHADLCEAQGPFSCRIISMSHSGEEGEHAYGRLQLAVAAAKARSFGESLGTAAGDAGGEQVSATITGEDLSKQIVDTEARLRARTVLRDRLMEVLQTRRGSVAELVEAERSVARVNEEIDQARSWLEEMKQRVSFSTINVEYRSGSAQGGDFITPIKNAFGSIGGILGNLFAGLIVLAATLLPLGAIGYAGWRLFRRLRPAKPATDES